MSANKHHSGFNRYFKFLGIGIALSYPLLVYLGLKHIPTGFFGLLLLLGLSLRAVGEHLNRYQSLALLILGIYSLSITFTGSVLLLRFYPVLVSLCLSMVFFSSLTAPEPLLTQLVKRYQATKLNAAAEIYLYRLTIIWGILLLINALVAAYTACCMSLVAWTLYNGLLSYFIMAGFFAAEFIFRQFYKRRHP